jgi:hypothetical protein
VDLSAAPMGSGQPLPGGEHRRAPSEGGSARENDSEPSHIAGAFDIGPPFTVIVSRIVVTPVLPGAWWGRGGGGR